MQALLLPVGADWYAVPLVRVREVVPAPALVPLPGAPPAVLGAFNLRGEVVPVLDTGVLTGAEPLRAAPFVAVAETPLGPGGLAMGAEPRTAWLADAAGPGRFAVDGGVATLLAVEELLTPAAIAGAA
jgi:purine-binding chemotaxis protein CheW